MKKLLASIVTAAVGMTMAGAAPQPVPTSTSPIYINNSAINFGDIPPQIDARAFLNRSIFEVSTTLPFQAQNVLYWTNTAVMSGFPGFRFENDTTGKARGKKKNSLIASSKFLQLPSSVFHNDGNITVSRLLAINATNIFNTGRLDGGETAKITILAAKGTADLSGSSIRVGVNNTFNTCNFFPSGTTPITIFAADASITDQYWGAGRNNDLGTNGRSLNLISLTNASSPFSLPSPRSPAHQVRMPSSFGSLVFTQSVTVPSSGCGFGYAAYLHVALDPDEPTNTLVNVVFVATNSLLSSNLFTDVRFVPTTGPAGNAYAAVVEFRSVDFDIVEQQLGTNYLTLADTSAAQTNITLVRPSFTTSVKARSVRRPSSYTWIKGRYCNFDFPFFAETNNAVFSPSIFYNSQFRTNTASTIYAADSVSIGGSDVLTPSTLGVNPALSDPTNFAGHISINAEHLNLANTRIRSQQFIGISTRDLISNSLPQLDAPFVDFNVRSTNADLLISNVAPATVSRVYGNLSAYSTVWNAEVTNSVSGQLNLVRYHVLIIDNCLQSAQPVTMNRFSVSAKNIVISDIISVNSGLAIEATSLTVQGTGQLNLPAGANLAFTNFQRLLNFTNDGSINVPASAYFGIFQAGHNNAKTVPALDNFVNRGSLNAASIFVRATNAQVIGTTSSPAFFFANSGVAILNAPSLVISNALLFAQSDVELHGNNLRLENSSVSAGTANNGFNQSIRGGLLIDATNSLGDFGTVTTNEWRVTSGVKIPRRPVNTGDLLGTHIYSTAEPFRESVITWPGQNRGEVAAGYSNNLALGRLTLDGVRGNKFRFRSAGVSNALYVDYLELVNVATNFNLAFGIDPDFTIYFADSNLEPEKLAGGSFGRIRWVSSYAGRQSSTSLVYTNGLTYTFNAALVRSKDIDSDGDGIVNADDCSPVPVPGFDTFGDQCVLVPSPLAASPKAARAGVLAGADFGLSIALAPHGSEAVLRWNAPANSASRVEFTDSLASGVWQTLTNFINGPDDARVTVRDAAESPLRVYRVRVDAGKP